MNYENILAFIPARSGSKGVPNKNIRKIGGVPLLEFSVFCACEAMAQGYISDVLVSTDSVEYLDLLSQYNIVKDYLRPPDLAGDKSPTVDAVRHALDWCEEKRSKSYDAVLILQPTAPFRTPEHIKDCIELLRANPDATCVAGVKLLEDQHPLRVYKLKKDRILMPFCRELLEPEPSRRQDFWPKAYLRNGTIYLTPVKEIQNTGKIRGARVLGYEMPEVNSINVDEHLDFLLADASNIKNFKKI